MTFSFVVGLGFLAGEKLKSNKAKQKIGNKEEGEAIPDNC